VQLVAWGLQIIILTAGIHLFLRFVRTTRGNPLIRGLFLSVLVGVVGLWGLATALELEELQHILQGSTGFIVVGLAVIFHPELRRGIAQLGERTFSNRQRVQGVDTLRNSVRAALAMARRRDGALIAFERESSLHTVAETGSTIQARVSAPLLESIFNPSSALHDGAVVVRENRITAAGCILPLTRGDRLDASKGTRHRAAVGLTEETDAVVLVVSEETGAISIAREGHLTEDVAADRLEAELRTHLELNGEGASAGGPGLLAMVVGVIRHDFMWLAGSLLLACGAWYAAHQSIRNSREFRVQVVDSTAVDRRAPREGEILILPPGEDVRVRTTSGDGGYTVTVTGSRAQFNDLGGSLRGTLQIEDTAWDGGPLDLDLVSWEDPVLGLDYRWKGGRRPDLQVERFATKRIQLTKDDVRVDVSRVDSRFQARLADVTFAPAASIEVRGPAVLVEDLGDGLELALEEIVLSPEDLGEVRVRVRLHSALVARGFSLDEDAPVDAVVPIVPVEREAGTIRKEVVLVCLTPEKRDLLERWTVPANAQTARFTIVTSGLIPLSADVGSPALLERKAAISRFVEENLRVYADVAELPPPEEGRSVPVRTTWIKDWRDDLDALGLGDGTLGTWEELDVRLESEASILLEPSPLPGDAESP
jgi:diadenylate cyclase